MSDTPDSPAAVRERRRAAWRARKAVQTGRVRDARDVGPMDVEAALGLVVLGVMRKNLKTTRAARDDAWEGFKPYVSHAHRRLVRAGFDPDAVLAAIEKRCKEAFLDCPTRACARLWSAPSARFVRGTAWKKIAGPHLRATDLSKRQR